MEIVLLFSVKKTKQEKYVFGGVCALARNVILLWNTGGWRPILNSTQCITQANTNAQKPFHYMTNCQRSYFSDNISENIFGPPHHRVYFDSKVFTGSQCKVVTGEVSIPMRIIHIWNVWKWSIRIHWNATDAASHLGACSADRMQSHFLICAGYFSGTEHAIPSQIGLKFFLIRQFFIDCQSQRRNVHQPAAKGLFAVSHAIMWRIMIDLHVHEGILPEARRQTHLFRAAATVVVVDSLCVCVCVFSGKMMDG